jgi:dTDP-4-dehydrorhamnose 3,5-epimerase
MNVITTAIPGLLLLEPAIHRDGRGSFFESFNKQDFERLTGVRTAFVQDNHSCSAKGVLRGLHFQAEKPQGKLVRVVRGAIYDVAVDLRPGSPTAGRWVGHELSEHNACQIWMPQGFAHGFLSLTGKTEVLYKTTDYYDPKNQCCIIWDDPTLRIDWPLSAHGIQVPELSAKDLNGLSFSLAMARYCLGT